MYRNCVEMHTSESFRSDYNLAGEFYFCKTGMGEEDSMRARRRNLFRFLVKLRAGRQWGYNPLIIDRYDSHGLSTGHPY